MPITDILKNEALQGLTATNNVILYNSVGNEIATVSATFSVATLGQQGDNAWRATSVAFNNIAAGTIVGSVAVFQGTSTTLFYISEETLSGTESERTIGPAGGNVVFDVIEVVLP